MPIMRWERFVGGNGLVNRIKSFVLDMLTVKSLRDIQMEMSDRQLNMSGKLEISIRSSHKDI